MGPLLAAWIILPEGRGSLVWFSLAAALAMLVLWRVGRWYKGRQAMIKKAPPSPVSHGRSARSVAFPMIILLTLMFSKFVYLEPQQLFYFLPDAQISHLD